MKKTVLVAAVSVMTAATAFGQAKPKLIETGKSRTQVIERNQKAANEANFKGANVVNISTAAMTVQARNYIAQKGIVSSTTGQIVYSKLAQELGNEVKQIISEGSLPRAEAITKVASLPEAVRNVKLVVANNKKFGVALLEAIAEKRNLGGKDYDLANALILDAVLTATTSKGKIVDATTELNNGILVAMAERNIPFNEIIATFEGKDRIITMVNNVMARVQSMEINPKTIGTEIKVVRDQENAKVLGVERYEEAKRCTI